MADVSISLGDIQHTKTIKVNGLGVFNVRKLGSDEALELSKKMRRRAQIHDELNRLDLTEYVTKNGEKLSDDKQKELDALLAKIDALSNELHAILDYDHELRKKRISDVNNGKKVDKLFSLVDDEGIEKLFRYAFGDLKVLEADDNPGSQEISEVSNEQ